MLKEEKFKDPQQADKELSKAGGVLDIGAGDNPHPAATVATDDTLYYPKASPPQPITVVIDKTARSIDAEDSLPLKLTRDTKLRLYWVGAARDLPDSWDNKFRAVISRNALGTVIGPAGFREAYSVLQKNGKLYILTGLIELSEISKVKNWIRQAGFTDVSSQYVPETDGIAFKAIKTRVGRGKLKGKVSKSKRGRRGKVSTTLGMIRWK